MELVKYLHQNLKIKYFTCSGLIITGNAINDQSQETQLTTQELTKILKEVNKYIKSHDLSLSFTSPGWLNEKTLTQLELTIPSCGACLSNMAIAPNGDVVPCQSWLSNDSLGNLLSVNWKKIWNSKKCKTIRKQSMNSENVCPLNDKNKKEDK